MFDNEFSPKFESVFRVFFIIWVSIWGLYNIVNLLVNYASLSAAGELAGNTLGLWWIETLGIVVSITCGLVLLFMMTSVPSRIAKGKVITKIGLMTTLAVFYYLFFTVADIFANAVFNSADFVQEFVFLSAWLLPSVVILIFHMAYFSDLRAYNRELQSATTPSQV